MLDSRCKFGAKLGIIYDSRNREKISTIKIAFENREKNTVVLWGVDIVEIMFFNHYI